MLAAIESRGRPRRRQGTSRAETAVAVAVSYHRHRRPSLVDGMRMHGRWDARGQGRARACSGMMCPGPGEILRGQRTRRGGLWHGCGGRRMWLASEGLKIGRVGSWNVC